MLDIIADKVYNSKEGRQEVFFDRTWHTLIDLYSYGHDIETAWLVESWSGSIGRSGVYQKAQCDYRVNHKEHLR